MQVNKQNKAAASFGLKALTVAAPLLAALPVSNAFAADAPSLTLGAGLRTSFVHTDNQGPAQDPSDFNVDNIRLYADGTILPFLKFTARTEYSGSPSANGGGGDNSLQLLDAIARFEFNDHLNIWAGRFLAPTDRANLYGVFYNNDTRPFNDGVQDGYPSEFAGRDNGVAYWG